MIFVMKNIYSGYNYWFNENLGELKIEEELMTFVRTV